MTTTPNGTALIDPPAVPTLTDEARAQLAEIAQGVVDAKVAEAAAKPVGPTQPRRLEVTGLALVALEQREELDHRDQELANKHLAQAQAVIQTSRRAGLAAVAEIAKHLGEELRQDEVPSIAREGGKVFLVLTTVPQKPAPGPGPKPVKP